MPLEAALLEALPHDSMRRPRFRTRRCFTPDDARLVVDPE